ncbi:MAG: hypothetical protein WBD31_32080, partial [Rubripirellula sp.]
AIEADLDGIARNAAIARAEVLLGEKDLGWQLAKPIEFVDSRARPSVQDYPATSGAKFCTAVLTSYRNQNPDPPDNLNW